jgi:hypothetical protein
MGIHAPFREGSPWAVAFGLAAGGTFSTPSPFWIDARLALRRRLVGGLFLALPLVAGFREEEPSTGTGRWRLGLGLDLGVTF